MTMFERMTKRKKLRLFEQLMSDYNIESFIELRMILLEYEVLRGIKEQARKTEEIRKKS